MPTITVKVEIPEELREQFAARVRAHGGDQSGYIREVLERELRTPSPDPQMTFREIFAPAEEGFQATGMSEEDLVEFTEEEIKRYRAERRMREA